jgi:NAD(P)-dependent dehydrogenase (short-subunit alcohol dehydrogenase family)
MAKLDSKVAVVTGGSSGIGFSTARELVAHGAKVIITGRDPGALERATAELGPNAVGVVSDASKLGDLDALVAKVQKLGGLDFLFFNAGIAKFAPLEAVTEQLYDEMLDINTKGAFFTVQRLVPFIREGGSIVFNTSVVNEMGLAGSSAYAATKAALRSLTRSFAAELLEKKIRVNAVSPGPISTPIFTKMGIPAEALDGMAADFTAKNPMKRFGQPEEVARAAIFLGFDATYTTGAELPVDGGFGQL